VSLALAALLAASAPARADVAVFASMHFVTPPSGCVSANGYHYAARVASDEGDRYVVDKRTAAKGPPGALKSWATCALSDDGLALLHTMVVPASKNGPGGVSAALNGKPIGAPVQEISELHLNRDRTIAAYVARTPQGYSVVSSLGDGPVMHDMPTHLLVGPSGHYYLTKWQDSKVVYRDHKPQASGNYFEIAAPPDLSRFAAYRSDTVTQILELDGAAKAIPSPPIRDLTFSADGRHFGYIHGAEVVIDDKTGPAPNTGEGETGSLSISPDGTGYWIRGPFGDPTSRHVYHAGKELGVYAAVHGDFYSGASRQSWIGFSPTGAHSAFLAQKSSRSGTLAVVDAAPSRSVPAPFADSVPIFDSEDEFHYIAADGDRVELVCVALGKTGARRGPCAQAAAKLGLHVLLDEP